MKRWKGLLLPVLLAGGGFLVYGHLSHGNREPVAYEAVPFRREPVEVCMESTAVVEPRNRVEIKPPIGGRIEEVLVDEGDRVTRGQIVGWMSSTERATLLDAARAQGEEMFRKWEDVYKPTPLIAPFSGTIIAREAELGQTVTTQDVTLVLSDRLIVNAQVDETDIGRVRAGAKVTCTLDAYPDVTVDGKVRRIAYEAVTVSNVTVYEVEIEPERVPACMKSGMTATVRFRIAAVDDTLTLPASAVLSRDGKRLVMLDDGNPETPPEPFRVLTGLESNGWVEILAGLRGDERVVRQVYAPEKAAGNGRSPFMPGRR